MGQQRLISCSCCVSGWRLWLFTCHPILKRSSFLGPVSLGRDKEKRVDSNTQWLLKPLLRCSICHICLYSRYIKQARMVPCLNVLGQVGLEREDKRHRMARCKGVAGVSPWLVALCHDLRIIMNPLCQKLLQMNKSFTVFLIELNEIILFFKLMTQKYVKIDFWI